MSVSAVSNLSMSDRCALRSVSQLIGSLTPRPDRHAEIRRTVVDALDLEPLAQAQPFNGQIRARMLDLLAQRDQHCVGMCKLAPQEIAETRQQGFGVLVALLTDERVGVRDRREQEGRVKAEAKCGELRASATRARNCEASNSSCSACRRRSSYRR
jgi:hypothetical protein